MKKLFLVVITCSLLLLAACNGDGDEPVSLESVFGGGSQGVSATFEPLGVQEGGTYTIFDTEGFQIEVNLKNLGEEDIEPGDVTVTLRGISLGDFSGITSGGELQNTEKLDKMSELNPSGQEELLDFTPGEDAEYNPDVTGFYDVSLFADIQYNYKTHVIVPRVCFKEDPQETRVCDTEGSKDVFVSGAPISVRSAQEQLGGRGIIVLRFEVENVGGGRVAKLGDEFITREQRIEVEVKTDPQDWECRSGGREDEIRLVDGRAELVCRLKEKLEKDALFTKQFELDLIYKYENVISENLRIKESLDE